jgi:choline dehydrogenase-like flavoprotein
MNRLGWHWWPSDLFIVDGSLFVTSGGVNPTSTIQALALYIADQMKQRLANLFD